MTLKNLFWDSCVFIRYLCGDTSAQHYDDISRFVDDARLGKRTIYYSTITLAEIRQEHFNSNDYGSIKNFFEDFGSFFIPIEPNPNILIATGELRSARSVNPGNSRDPSRSIATSDAIIMMSCVFARDALGISDIILQTTDEGKGKNWYGRAVPIIGFERWYPESVRTDRVKEVCSLQRLKPIHPEPMLEGILVPGNFGKPR